MKRTVNLTNEREKNIHEHVGEHKRYIWKFHLQDCISLHDKYIQC